MFGVHSINICLKEAMPSNIKNPTLINLIKYRVMLM